MKTRPRRRAPVWLLISIAAYVVFLAALTVMNRSGADLWWPGAMNLYLPQVLWAVPGLFLVILSLKWARQWTWLPLLGIVWVAGPLMGFCWPLQITAVPFGVVPLRVMTWNVKYGLYDAAAHLELRHDIDRNKPDVILLQDADGLMNGPFREYFSGWNVRSLGEYVIASRLPLGVLQVKSLPFPRGQQLCLRTQLQIGGRTVVLYNVHLETPRWGLNALRETKDKPSYLPKAIEEFESNVAARLAQAQKLREYVRQERGPVIIAGDLNSPDASRVCALLREAGFHDAFAEAGKGYGYTYGHFLLRHRIPALKVSWMRIDHIMTNSKFQSQQCRTGTGKASDHRPVIADLILIPD